MLSEGWSCSAPASAMFLGEDIWIYPGQHTGETARFSGGSITSFACKLLNIQVEYLVNFEISRQSKALCKLHLSSLESVNCFSSLLQIHLDVSFKPGGLRALCAAHMNLEFSKSRFVRVPKMCAKPEIYWLSYGYHLPQKPVSRADWRYVYLWKGLEFRLRLWERELI